MEPLRPITDEEIRAYEEDGAVCIRGQFDQDWIDHMMAVITKNLEDPAGSVMSSGDDEPGKVIANSHMARTNPDFMDFRSPGTLRHASLKADLVKVYPGAS